MLSFSLWLASETSASTLTVASLALGLHPDVWNKVKKEQAAMIAKVW